jgi:AraC-like DNA-binding protein
MGIFMSKSNFFESSRVSDRRPESAFKPFGFSYLSGPEVPFVQLHQHDELEIGCPHDGEITAVFGASTVRIPPEHFVVFWATQPHGPIAVSEGVSSSVIHIPTAWFLDWDLPAGFAHRLLHGEVMICPPRSGGISDGLLIKHWVNLMQRGDEQLRRVVLLEVEARLRQFAAEAPATPDKRAKSGEVTPLQGQARQFGRIVALVAERCREPLSVSEIAEELGLHPKYLMGVFRRLSGMTLVEYIAQQRVAYAQRLLATTSLKIIDVAMDSGFGSVCRFHAVFARLCGTTPRQYRARLRGNGARSNV